MILRRYLIIIVQPSARHPIECYNPTPKLQLRVDKRSEMPLALVTTAGLLMFSFITQSKFEKLRSARDPSRPQRSLPTLKTSTSTCITKSSSYLVDISVFIHLPDNTTSTTTRAFALHMRLQQRHTITLLGPYPKTNYSSHGQLLLANPSISISSSASVRGALRIGI
jgi:hypothetical protein